MPKTFPLLLALLISLEDFSCLLANNEEMLSENQKLVLAASEKIFKSYDISYVYGGGKLGTPKQCKACNLCLEEHQPQSSERFTACPQCKNCSLDCSHFTQQVFKEAGFFAPYLTSKLMASLPASKLLLNYHLLDFDRDLTKAKPGDLLVYKDHVVLLTHLWSFDKGDIIHATGGRDIKGPGNGLQKERLVGLSNFRGPLLRILRHKRLVTPGKLPRIHKVMRPVAKKKAP